MGGGRVGFWRHASGHGAVVVGEVAEAETERGELNNSLRDGKGCPLANFGGEPSKLIRGALSCDRWWFDRLGMVVLVLKVGGNGALSMTQPWRSIREYLCRGEGDAEGE